MILAAFERCCQTRRTIRPEVSLLAAVLSVGTLCGLIGLAEAATAAFSRLPH